MIRTNAKRSLVVLAAAAVATGMAALGATGAYASGPLKWHETTTPSPGNWYCFDEITALSKKDAWAVGSGPDKPMRAHWDGSDWTQAQPPEGMLFVADIGAAASNDVWTVGGGGARWYEGKVGHYDGQSWSAVDVPLPDVGENGQTTLSDVAVSGDEVWATGIANRSIDGERVNSGFTLHFDGADWTLDELPIPEDSTDVDYTGINILANGHVITSGVRFVPVPDNPHYATAEPWVMDYDGTTWTDTATSTSAPKAVTATSRPPRTT